MDLVKGSTIVAAILVIQLPCLRSHIMPSRRMRMSLKNSVNAKDLLPEISPIEVDSRSFVHVHFEPSVNRLNPTQQTAPRQRSTCLLLMLDNFPYIFN